MRVATRCPRPSPPVGTQGPSAPLSRRKVSVVSHAQYVLTVTAAPASRVKAAVSKAAWWPWSFDLESGVRVTCATSVQILVFLGLSVLDLGPMYATDRRHCLMPPPIRGEHNNTDCSPGKMAVKTERRNIPKVIVCKCMHNFTLHLSCVATLPTID